MYSKRGKKPNQKKKKNLVLQKEMKLPLCPGTQRARLVFPESMHKYFKDNLSCESGITHLPSLAASGKGTT
jgi:hypothetical protein